jgi:hypothetical protein
MNNLKYVLYGCIIFMGLQAFVLPVTYSCEQSFIRQTINSPAWAKTFWEKLGKELEDDR